VASVVRAQPIDACQSGAYPAFYKKRGSNKRMQDFFSRRGPSQTDWGGSPLMGPTQALRSGAHPEPDSKCNISVQFLNFYCMKIRIYRGQLQSQNGILAQEHN